MGTRATSPATDLKARNDKRAAVFFVLTAILLTGTVGHARVKPCSACKEWNRPQKPFRIYGDTYYVGTHGLSSILITSENGDILIDGDLAESAQQIVGNIRALGFRIEDVKIILNSHVHFDHAGGLAELQRLSGARMIASPWSASVLRTGMPGRGDPQYRSAEKIAPVRDVHELHDGERLTLGKLVVTAHLTPGHTPGGTSWTWTTCEGQACRDMVYADSVTPVSDDGFSFLRSREYPHAVGDFEKSFQFFETTSCDILITTHPEASELWDRLARREKGVMPDPMVTVGACRGLAERGRQNLGQRLANERKK